MSTAMERVAQLLYSLPLQHQLYSPLELILQINLLASSAKHLPLFDMTLLSPSTYTLAADSADYWATPSITIPFSAAA